MNDKLFIDAANLNVIFMVNGKFCMGSNYSSCPDRLTLDAQALGGSFDVYVSVWPRQPEEGDVVISGLNAGNIKFWALKSEIKTIGVVLDRIPGVNDIYICNALACFMSYARVENFQSVLRHGQRYIMVTAQGRLPQSMTVYKNQREVYESNGDDFTCYGDIDLIDADSIRAQYTELSKWRRTTLVPLTSLIASNSTAYKLAMDDVITQMARYVPENVHTEVVEEEVEEEEVVEEVVEERKIKERVDWMSVIMAACICICCFLVGYGYQFRDAAQVAQGYADSLGPYQEEIEFQRSIKDVYDKSVDIGAKFADLLEYSKNSELEVSVSTMNGYADRVVLQFNCTDMNVKDQFVYYLERRYSVSDVNQYGSVNNTDGTITYQYAVTMLF